MSTEHNGLTGLVIGNFKAFAETQRIPIRPLTLIYGPNSAGKSSIIQSLLLTNHAAEQGNLDVHQTKLGGEALDLGGFRQYVHKHDAERLVEVGMEINIPRVEKVVKYLGGFGRIGIRFKIGVPIDRNTEPNAKVAPEVMQFDLLLDDCLLLQLIRGDDGRLSVKTVNFDNSTLKEGIELILNEIRNTEIRKPDKSSILSWIFREEEVRSCMGDHRLPKRERPLSKEELARGEQEYEKALADYNERMNEITNLKSDSKALTDAIIESFRKVPFSTNRLFPKNLVPEGEESDYDYSAFGYDPHRIMDEYMVDLDTSNAANNIARILRFELENLFALVAVNFRRTLSKICYLGPLRCYPPRHFSAIHEHDPNWFSGGGHAWERVRRDPEVREYVNHWLTAPDRLAKSYELAVRSVTDIATIAPKLAAGLEDALGKLQTEPNASITVQVEELLKKLVASNPVGLWSEVILRDKQSGTELSHRDIGQGISQVLPVLISAFGSGNALIAIEQPELHLHPALEAELGDVFIESALGERANRFLLESHSEHILLQIMRRMRETHSGTLPKGKVPVTPNDVAVLYVETVGTRSIIREMPLNVRGELIKDWPGGFFEEGLREVLT